MLARALAGFADFAGLICVRGLRGWRGLRGLRGLRACVLAYSRRFRAVGAGGAVGAVGAGGAVGAWLRLARSREREEVRFFVHFLVVQGRVVQALAFEFLESVHRTGRPIGLRLKMLDAFAHAVDGSIRP